jgi:hypothetical protein
MVDGVAVRVRGRRVGGWMRCRRYQQHRRFRLGIDVQLAEVIPDLHADSRIVFLGSFRQHRLVAEESRGGIDHAAA